MNGAPTWTDTMTAFGTVFASVFAGAGTFISLCLYKEEKQQRTEDRKRYKAEAVAAEERQARQVNAWFDPQGPNSMVFVRNNSDQPILNCTVLYWTLGNQSSSQPKFHLHVPALYDIGLIPAQGKKSFAADITNANNTYKRALLVIFRDASEQIWLRDQSLHLHRLGPDGALCKGLSPELDAWMDARPDAPLADL